MVAAPEDACVQHELAILVSAQGGWQRVRLCFVREIGRVVVWTANDWHRRW